VARMKARRMCTKWAQKVWLPILVHTSIKNGSKPSHSLES